MKQYQQRLANVLDIPSPDLPEPNVIPFPDKRDLYIPIDDIRINLIDAYELRKCGLFNLIAERNSILGKVQDKTRQLRYEIMLTNGLQYCIQNLPADSTLIHTLQDIHKQKQTQLPLHIWNMLTTGQEWRQQWVIHHQVFPLTSFYGFDELMGAISYLTLINAQIEKAKYIENTELERLLTHQQTLHPFHYFGQLIYSMETAIVWLNSITSMLADQQQHIICGKNHNQQKAEYLSNVFYKFFAKDIQPYLAKLDSQYNQIQPELNELFSSQLEQHLHLQGYYNHYLTNELQLRFRTATLNHVEQWKQIFQRCNIKVGTR
ncbi:DUF3080 domain-containing protein [Photobacterium aquae]|uniref:DUF3080 domain-containing protein n=1 Tax=Photobacterium aquae TaxID=1195763 RepID=UPI0023E3C2AE|nr:DUF3080 domain-containing protein [Photobacterium aquae]